MKQNDSITMINRDLSPANFDEFSLGMCLAALVDMMLYQNPDEVDPNVFDAVLGNSESALEYWREKYDEFIKVAGEKSQGVDDRE